MSKSESSKVEKADDDQPAADAVSRTAADVAFIEALARILKDNDLAELDVTREYGEDDELQVRLSRVAASIATAPLAAPMAPPQVAHAAAQAVSPSPAPAALADAEAAPAANPADDPGCVTSPMVGTAYLARSPGAEPFIQVGDTVTEGQTLLIIEAMKHMNDIPAPHSGTVKQILVADAQPVEFGAPLVIIG